MDIFKEMDRINLLHKLVDQEVSGTPEELAGRLGISRSALYNLIEDLKSYDVPIVYSKVRKTFMYTRPFMLRLHYSFSFIENEEILQKVSGGMHFFTSVHFFGR